MPHPARKKLVRILKIWTGKQNNATRAVNSFYRKSKSKKRHSINKGTGV